MQRNPLIFSFCTFLLGLFFFRCHFTWNWCWVYFCGSRRWQRWERRTVTSTEWSRPAPRFEKDWRRDSDNVVQEPSVSSHSCWPSVIDFDSLQYLELPQRGVIFESNRIQFKVTPIRQQSEPRKRFGDEQASCTWNTVDHFIFRGVGWSTGLENLIFEESKTSARATKWLC